MDTQKLIERVALDERFQAACQRYAHGNGSSHAIAATAVRANAAPELLEAARAAHALLGKLDPCHPGAVETFQQLGLAIAKATA